MTWTRKYLHSAKIPSGKTKLTLADPEGGGLYFEVRKKTRGFIFRMSRNGKSVSRTIGAFPDVTIAEARQAARRLRRANLDGTNQTTVRNSYSPKLDVFVAEHFFEHSRRKHKFSEAVIANYKAHIKGHFGSMRLDEITRLEVHKWANDLASKGLMASTMNKLIVLFGQILGLAETLEVSGAPERRKLGLKQIPARPTHTVFLKPDEATRLMKAVRNSNNLDLPDIVTLLLVTGARKGEALNARWEHIDLESRIWLIPISKNGQPRFIQLGHSALELLKARKHKTQSPYVFANPTTGQPYRCIFYAWKMARTEAGLPHVRLHDLRHSYASALVNEGVPLYDVQQLLGHRSIKTTQRYAHLSQDKLQASARKIDNIYGHPQTT